ncbi:MAG: DUF5060 domain-containing protein, partial [Bacteroidales bacterium]|nr:DUF5060 domain-containing protein [Bacteroidales bacterium]
MLYSKYIVPVGISLSVLQLSPALFRFLLFLLPLYLPGTSAAETGSLRQGNSVAAYSISGELMKWHRVVLSFDGPETSEDAAENPFLNYRMVVRFTSGNILVDVPGYFAADGNAAETGATSGNQWRVNFSPIATGTWNFEVFFHRGQNI